MKRLCTKSPDNLPVATILANLDEAEDACADAAILVKSVNKWYVNDEEALGCVKESAIEAMESVAALKTLLRRLRRR